MPELCVDYGFISPLAGTGDTRQLAFIAARERVTGAWYAEVVPRKGEVEFAVKSMVDFVTWLGYSRISVRTDGEAPITALMAAVAARLRAANIDCTVNGVPRGDPQAQGVAESAVRVLKQRMRTLWSHVQEVHGLKEGAGLQQFA
eukprot:6484672-Amphidinium_carterae.1